jgi:DNA-binding SARP family transcriptional activator/transcriptional regulator with XRE-family HTH domain/tetratricopeptide (TPR) repeat protein
MNEAPDPDLGASVRAHRLAIRLSQQDLARLAEISVGALRDLEQGRTRRPRESVLARLDAVLGGSLGVPDRASPPRVELPGQHDPRPAAGTQGLWLRVLGPLGGWRDGVALTLGPPQQRAVLGMLALRAGTAVHRQELVDAVWGDDPPAAAINQVQAYVGRLRQILDAGRGHRDPDGLLLSAGTSYRLRVDAGELDWLAFRRMLAQATRYVATGDLLAGSEQYEQALALWHGDPLDDIDSMRRGTAVAALRRAWSAAVAGYANVALHAGRPATVLPYLWALVEQEPLDENAHALLMRALVGSAKPAAALEVFAAIRDRLGTQLGIRPGRQLAELHVRILREELPDPGAAASPVPAVDPAAGPGPGTGTGSGADPGTPDGPLPRQLPAPVRGFVGRTAELATLTGLLLGRRDPAGGQTVVISAIDGTAGIGKTALAIHWAHQVVDRFPDGQLYVDLRGFDPTAPPPSTAEVIRGFLDALHVPAERMPAGVDAQIALYRSLLAERRMLVVLDNARDSSHVRPLLPANPQCLALVTSRRRLTSLSVAEGAHLVTIDPLRDTEARQLLSVRLGARRMADEGLVIDELVHLCAGLPLALSIAAARGSTNPNVPIGALVAQLRDSSQQLDTLSTGEAGTDLRSLFGSSYQHLSQPARRVFRLLGPLPGPEVSLPVAASLAGVGVPHARAALDELCTANLLTERAPGRFVMHDLLRTYAAELADRCDSEQERAAATGRVFNHYLNSLQAVDQLRYPQCKPIMSAVVLPGVSPEQFMDPDQALAWCQDERGAISALLGQSAAADPDGYLRGDRWYLWLYFHLWAHWHDLAEARRVVLTANGRPGEPGVPAARPGTAADGRLTYRHLVIEAQGRGEPTAAAYCLFGLMQMMSRQGRDECALSFARRALDWFATIGDRPGQALTLHQIGRFCLALDRPGEAATSCQRALSLYRELGDPVGEAAAAVGLGLAGVGLDDHPQAAHWYEHAADLYGRLGQRDGQSEALIHLGDARKAMGCDEAAGQSWHDAMALLADSTHPNAQLLHARRSPLVVPEQGDRAARGVTRRVEGDPPPGRGRG